MNPRDPCAVDERPFEGMRIEPASALLELSGRGPCGRCLKSRMYYCYTCRLPVPGLSGRIPRVRPLPCLPVKVDIIKHKSEIDGKSTAAHGPILAPDLVTVHEYPDVPDYSQEEGVYLIYPSATAESVGALFGDPPSEEPPPSRGTLMKERLRPAAPAGSASPRSCPVRRAVFIDATWNQSRGIYKDERVRRLPCVVLQNRASQFWRHQKGSPRWYLSTIEAVHQFLLEAHASAWGVSPSYGGPHCENFFRSERPEAYDGQYDNLLYFFSFMYTKIHSYYGHDRLMSYKRPF